MSRPVRCIVTVLRAGDTHGHDLALPADLPVGQLVDEIARALRWDRDSAGGPLRYRAEAYPPGRVLEEGETLAQAEVWDGAWLMLQVKKGDG